MLRSLALVATLGTVALLTGALGVYVLRPLELEVGLLSAWQTIAPVDNTIRIGTIWVTSSIVIVAVSLLRAGAPDRSILDRRRSPFRSLRLGLVCFGMIALSSFFPAFQMSNQLEHHVPFFDRPDLAGPLLKVLWLAGLLALIAGAAMLVVGLVIRLRHNR